MSRHALCALSFLFLVLPRVGLSEDRQIIEVKFYHFRSAESAEKFDGMMEHAVTPVIKNQGITASGVFTVTDSQELDNNARVVITAFDSMDSLLALRRAYTDDPNFWPHAQDYLLQERGHPAYTHVESMLLHAFTGMPTLKVPGEGKNRIFELRTYKSENEIQGRLKVRMFNEGEIEIFEKVGLPAVFYGEAIVAPNLPQLTYMLVHDDAESQKQAWQKFLQHPAWKSLSSEEPYQVIKLKITKHMLAATDYSMIQ